MTQELFVREHVAVSQKLPNGETRGYNYWVEAGFALDAHTDEAHCRQSLRVVLTRLDHKALGEDVDLGFKPSSVQICRWIHNELSKLSPQYKAIRLLRGDGSIYGTHPTDDGTDTAPPPAVG